MKKFYGGEPAKRGFYVKLATGEFVQLYGKKLILPGGREVKYIRVPGALAVVAGPLAGLAFVIFLPLIGILGAIRFIVYKAGGGIRGAGRRLLRRLPPLPKEQEIAERRQ